MINYPSADSLRGKGLVLAHRSRATESTVEGKAQQVKGNGSTGVKLADHIAVHI